MIPGPTIHYTTMHGCDYVERKAVPLRMGERLRLRGDRFRKTS